MIKIDGSEGEGGGQVIRTALSLALLTGKPFRIENIRAGRSRPGLLRQHLTAVNACLAISSSSAKSATINSRELEFIPGEVRGGEYSFSVGTAGSTSLVLQSILLPLLTAKSPSHVTIQGGTHNPWSPPFDFIDSAFIPLLGTMGASISARLERPGFYPAGGGEIRIEISPTAMFRKLSLLKRGPLIKKEVRAIVAGVPRSVAEREISTFRDALDWPEEECFIDELSRAYGPGNIVLAKLSHEFVTEVFCAFGEKGVQAESVAAGLAKQVSDYISLDAPVGPHLADQLLLPCLWAGDGEFITGPLSTHFETNLGIIKKFLDSNIEVSPHAGGRIHVAVRRSNLS